jgi:hypothetical protein
MIELKGFPLRDQLRDIPSEDGKPAENASEDCAPTSIAAGVQHLTGAKVSADRLKDDVYGQGYVGGGAARSYVAEVAKLGVRLTVRSGSQAQLIGILREELRAGHPCLITMPSHWNTAPKNPMHPGNSHCGVVYAIDETDSGQMWVMNPWRGFAQKQSIAWWRARLCYGQVWPMARIEVAKPTEKPQTVPASGLPAGWSDDGQTLTAPNGQPVVDGFRAFVLERLQVNAWPGGLPQSAEWKTAAGMAVQPFDQTTLLWNPGDRAPRYANVTELSALVRQLHQAA